MSCSNNVKQIALALHAYHDTYGELPPAYVADADGRRMHSWRVLILPFLEEKPLFDAYRLDEPWDGPHNRQLAERMPSAYRCPSYTHDREHHGDAVEGDEWRTQYVALVGDETAFPAPASVSLDEVADGPDQTLMLVELHADCVPWMSPYDISPRAFLQLLGSDHPRQKHHPGGLLSATADGRTHFLTDQTPRRTVLELATRAGGEDPEAF